MLASEIVAPSGLVRRRRVLGADGREPGGRGRWLPLAVRGIDGLDGYFARYLPQLVLAVIVPVTVVVTVAIEDWLSALILIVTLPLIPLFMALIGMATQDRKRIANCGRCRSSPGISSMRSPVSRR